MNTPGGFPGRDQVFRVLQSRPNTPGRIATMVFLLTLAIPILALALIAGVISVVVFLVLSGWSRLIGSRQPDWAQRDQEGRKGVRVRK